MNLKTIVLTSFSLLSLCVSAQDAQPEKIDLATELSRLDSITKSNQGTIDAQTKLKEQKKARIAELKKSISKSNLRKLSEQRDSLKALKESAPGRLQNDMATIHEECQNVMTSLLSQFSADSAALAQVEAELAGLQDVRKEQIAEMLQQVDSKWLSKSFAQLDSAELEAATLQYIARAATNQSLDAARKKMEGLRAAYRIYRLGLYVVNHRYDATEVGRSLDLVKKVREQEKNTVRKKELSRLFAQLDDYQATVQIFQDLILELDKKKSFAEMQKEIKKQEDEDEVISSIQAIPWLKKQYEDYYRALGKGQANNAARKVIMELKP